MNIWDHFDQNEQNMPFSNGQEETNAYLRWLDMFLLAAKELKNKEDEAPLREELRRAAELLGSRVQASIGKEITAENGLGISKVASEYGLYDFGFFCLLMATASEMDAHYVYAFREVSDYDVQFLTFAFAEDLYSIIAGDKEVLNVHRIKNTITRCPLFTIIPSKDGEGSLLDGFAANRQLSSILKGDYVIDAPLNEFIFEENASSDDDRTINKDEIKKLRTYLEHSEKEAYLPGVDGTTETSEIFDEKDGVIVHIKGMPGSGRKSLVRKAIDSGKNVLFVLLDRGLTTDLGNAARYVSDILVRARLLDLELAVICEEKANKAFLDRVIRLAITQKDRLFVITGKDISLDENQFNCSKYTVETKIPTAAERQLIWEKKLEGMCIADDVDITELAGKYRLYPGVIANCVELARSKCDANGKDKISKKELSEAVLSNTTSALDELCDRIPLKFTWDDLVIDERQKVIMETLCSRVKNRSLVDEEWGFSDKITYGRGVSLILFGAPGTGKTMAAQVMAKEIGMALYRVDLSQLVDKYIGETEKNIGKIFDAASDGNVILFFDEADALFSKRTEVASSNDKHANTEVAFLLQKIEQHEGVTFLATNRFNDFDAAFIRRINYAVRIERPDAATRLKLYEKILPEKTPKDNDINLKYYADNFELSGSEIKEVLYSAAFMAAAENKKLANRHILQSLKLQQEKTGKIVSGAELSRFIY